MGLSNLGFSELGVTNVTAVAPAFGSFFTAPFTIVPQGFVELTVTFRPEAATAYTGTLTIDSDDRKVTVPLTGPGR